MAPAGRCRQGTHAAPAPARRPRCGRRRRRPSNTASRHAIRSGPGRLSRPCALLLGAFLLPVAPMNKPAELKLDTVPVWINGKALAPSGRYGEVFNPAAGQGTKRGGYADPRLIDSTVKAAAAAFPEWRDTPPLRRARV